MPKVSVIVPVYNVEKYIGRCIESIQKQTLTDWELILVDDCSPDNSFDVIQEYAKQDSRIIVRCFDVNHGPMIARRWGDMLSKGEYITYCDGDDTLSENALNSLYNEAKISNADIVIGGYSVIKANGKRKDVVLNKKKNENGEELLEALLKRKVPQTLWCKLFKADVIKGHEYKVIDHMTNAEDAYLLYQMIPHIHTVVYIDDIVYNYFQNNESSSNRRFSDNALDNIMLVNSLRVSMIEKYPQFEKDILCLVSDVLNTLYIEGYNKDGLLQRLLERNHLQDYISDKVVLSTHSFLYAMKLLIRKHILRR